ncbi:MAG: glycosyltransferase, partial [Bacteroidales bacterium]|nr:glycosyltransferase [Bacteroidales bacterium]
MIKLINNLDKEMYSVEVLLLKHSIVADKLRENNIPYRVAQSAFFRKFYTYLTYSEAAPVKWFHINYYLVAAISWLLCKYYFAKNELQFKKFDIIHLNSSVLTDWLMPSRKTGAKVVIHIREPFRNKKFDPVYRILRKQMKLYADHIIAISSNNADRIDIPAKTTVVYNYSNIPSKLSPEESYRSKTFLYLGGSDTIKGFFTLIKSLKYIDEEAI